MIGVDIFPDRQQNKYIYDELQTDKFFSIRMVGVENSKRGMGVATELIRRLNINISLCEIILLLTFIRSILFAGCLGFQGIKTEATGNFSKFAFSTVGLLPTNSIKYEDFEFEGKKVFSGMGVENPEITFMRKKFFQSSLNYII